MTDLEAMEQQYIDFLVSKIDIATWEGWDVDDSEIHPSSLGHQAASIKWAAGHTA